MSRKPAEDDGSLDLLLDTLQAAGKPRGATKG